MQSSNQHRESESQKESEVLTENNDVYMKSCNVIHFKWPGSDTSNYLNIVEEEFTPFLNVLHYDRQQPAACGSGLDGTAWN